MSASISRAELEQLMEEHELAYIRDHFLGRMDKSSREYFEDYEAQMAQLDGLSANLYALAPPVPETVKEARVVSISWWKKSVQAPVWSVPFLAAAMLLMGFLIPTNQPDTVASVDVPTQEVNTYFDELMDNVRGIDKDRQTTELDKRIADSYLERAMYFYDQGNTDGYKQAIPDLVECLTLDPTNNDATEYLAICVETLGGQIEAGEILLHFGTK